MRTIRRILCAYGLLVVHAFSATSYADSTTPDLADYLDDEEIAEALEEGNLVGIDKVDFPEIFADRALPKGQSTLVLFLIRAKSDDAWALLRDFDVQHEFMPRMVRSELRSTDANGVQHVCYEHDVLWIESANCFFVTSLDANKLLWGVLDMDSHDDRLEGVTYFWTLQPWGKNRTLVAYYQKIDYAGIVSAFGHHAFIGPKTTAKAFRKRIEKESPRR